MKTIAKLLALAALIAAPLFAQPSGNTLPRNNPTFAGTLTGPLEVLNQPGIATTSTDALTLQNATASTSGATVQYSPRLHFVGHAWNTTATAADNYLELIEELRPASAATPTASLAWAFRRSTAGTGSFVDFGSMAPNGTGGGILLTALGTNQSITLTPSGTGQILVPAGAASTPIYSFTGDSDTGFYSATANGIEIALGGNQSGRLYAPDPGGVGLRSTTNGATLAMASAGSFVLSAAGTNQSITLTPSGTGAVEIATAVSSANSLHILNSGNNEARFSLQNGAGTSIIRTMSTGDMSLYVAGGGSPVITFNTNAGEKLRMANSGNLLLGGLTTDDTVNVLQNPGATLSAVYKGGTNALTGAGAVSVATDTTKYTTAGTGDALTLANGTDGQIKRVILDVLTSGGHTAVLTPTTKTGFSTVTFTAAGQSVTMEYVTTRGWVVTGSYGVTIAP